MGYAAEMELKNLKRRTAEGRAVAISKGSENGKEAIIQSPPDGRDQEYESRGRGYGAIAKSLGMSKTTVHRFCKKVGVR